MVFFFKRLAQRQKHLHNLNSSLVVNKKEHRNGGIAQLGERLHGMQEVSGSIPLTSTKKRRLAVESCPLRLEA
ncbi:protein of unknown function [Alcaligenes faecalis subsp. faecalis]|nr:protein of unknown function [Alcaligenes faecalis subsp. faecalis]